MKRLTILLTALILLICSGFAFSGGLPDESWEAELEISHMTYEQKDTMEEDGFMYGLDGSYTFRNDYMLRAEGRLSYGWLDYTGSDSGTANSLPNTVMELRGVGGYDLTILHRYLLTPYIGLGYRYIKDAAGGKTTTTSTSLNDKETSYYYAPIGLDSITKISNSWNLWANLEYDYFIDGTVTTGSTENDQDTGYGLRASAKFIKDGALHAFSTVWENIAIEPFIRYWWVDKSDTVSGTTEERNNSTEFGLHLSVAY